MCAWLGVLLCVLACSVLHAQEFFLHDGDKVVFFGDSITEQKLFTSDIEDFTLTRYPEFRVDFIQSGWGGERVDGGTAGSVDDRLQTDVIAYRPSVVVVMLGMNDGRYQPSNPARIQAYRRGLSHIVDQLLKSLPSTRIVLLTPSPYDDVTRAPSIGSGYNQLLVSFGEVVKEIGEQRHLLVIDLNKPFLAALHLFEAKRLSESTLLLPDRIHPSPAGHLLMAQIILQAWHAAPVVTAVTIDAAQDVTLEQKNTAVSAVWSWGHDLSWTQTDAILPFFVDTRDPPMEHLLAFTGFQQQLNREYLRIQNIQPGTYALWVDDMTIGRFTERQLQEGINLATRMNPMLMQAASVHKLTAEHNDVHTLIRRQLHYFYPEDESISMKNALIALQNLDDDVVVRQRLAVKPEMHSYLLRSFVSADESIEAGAKK